MRKIPLLFLHDKHRPRVPTPDVTPEAKWVVAGEGTARRKYDGHCVMFDGEQWWSQFVHRWGRGAPPQGFREVEQDQGGRVSRGWEPAESSVWAELLTEALLLGDHHLGVGAASREPEPGTYELCGPRIHGNPDLFKGQVLIAHNRAQPLADVPVEFEPLMNWLIDHPAIEGVVWHHEDGRMAKCKRTEALEWRRVRECAMH